jgi:acetyl esterase/lipase
MTRKSPYWLAAACAAALSLSKPISAEIRVEKNVVYGMYSGLALLMDVYYPENPNGYGIVFISGSGWSRGLSLDATPLKESGQEKVYAMPLAEAGYTVFGINHRAAPRFRHPAHLEDAQRAVRFVRHNATEFGIDPARIGAMGGSSGGHLVSMLGVLNGEGDPEDPSPINRESAKVQCVVARAAPVDLRKMPDAPLFGFRETAGREGTVEYRQLADASPLTYVSSDDPPFLLIHGDADPTVPFEQSEIMKAALGAAGVKAELLTIPGGGHGATFASLREGGESIQREPKDPPDYVGAMVRWFDQHLAKH